MAQEVDVASGMFSVWAVVCLPPLTLQVTHIQNTLLGFVLYSFVSPENRQTHLLHSFFFFFFLFLFLFFFFCKNTQHFFSNCAQLFSKTNTIIC